jgi:putative transposase
VCGIPDVLYTDHGSDFTSRHLEQVAADLHLRLVFSTAGVPQGRGKVERFFGTVTTELLPTLPGSLAPDRAGAPVDPPQLTLGDLDSAVGRYITAIYHPRAHSETRHAPVERWAASANRSREPCSTTSSTGSRRTPMAGGCSSTTLRRTPKWRPRSTAPAA